MARMRLIGAICNATLTRISSMVISGLVIYLTLGLTKVGNAQDYHLEATQKLRQHCESCHGLGGLRFIRTDDDEQMWKSLFVTKSPRSQKIWAEAIINVLKWPSDETYPAFDKPMTPPDRDWMPKGYSRIELHFDTIGEQPARKVILEELQKVLNEK